MPEEIEVPLEDVQDKLTELHHERHSLRFEHERQDSEEEDGGSNSTGNWTRYVALSTAILAVIAAIGSLQAGKFVNEAILEKNEQVAHLTQASDQWSYYQAKGIKSLIVKSSAPQESERYTQEQEAIKEKAQDLEKEAARASHLAELDLARHERFALSVSLCQIAIALSAIAALTRKRNLWVVSLVAGGVSLALLLYSFSG